MGTNETGATTGSNRVAVPEPLTVAVVGGGPAGLYASLLLKKEYPQWDVTVYERDPADNTYGWGVVFSDATLSNLREADARTHERISDAFVRWDPIDVYVDDERHRCGGHTFAGIMRSDLLRILQERAAEIGVELRHETAIDDPAELADECDLLIGADGLNSAVRETWEETFRPSIEFGSARFAWFGTEKPFDVFTFVFRENEHGLWRVHAYPGRKSTFIVECTESTWRNAGMDEADEETALAYFEDLFSDHLEGHELLAKLYQWRQFPTVTCRRWSMDDDVVLLGDAAHTAHFSVGSGTKLAMEDAIALLEGFREHGSDVSGALNWYEKERRPRVEGIQDAAERSQTYFETVERLWDLPPRQFAYNLLTRSGRISYGSLKLRDVEFADDYDRWYQRAGGVRPAQTPPTHNDTEASGTGGVSAVDSGDGSGTNRGTALTHGATDGGASTVEPVAALPPMFQPLTLREITYPNRTALELSPTHSASDGIPDEQVLEMLIDRASSGPGLLLTDPVAVAPEGRISPGSPGLYETEHADAWRETIEKLREHSRSAVGCHLFHAGRRGASAPRDRQLDRPLPEHERWETIAPSEKPYLPGGPTPGAMGESALEATRDAFASAARRADEAGFDHLQLHAGHGYLLSSFLSPLSNEREDEYGGALENRMRYPLEVFDAVRDVWPAEKPLGVTLQATDWNLQGLKTHESRQVAAALAERDCDLLAIVAGQATIRERPRYDPTVLADFAELYRNEVGIPVLSTSYVTTYDEVNTLVAAGRADLCRFTR